MEFTADNYKPADSKREEFRRYLEKSGVLDSLTKVLVALYEEPEKPSSAVDFLRQHIAGGLPDNSDIEALRLEISQLKERNKELEIELSILKGKCEKVEDKVEVQQTS
ncbi:c-Myc-binding protein-like isoform X1 [Hydra vulgaris]|uniref:c-Myc-binding protein-like isoform X1 n=1 Tax=Hydra vulgaris TaxID=6087 RepID=A0ABM4BVT2_HYDVU